MRRHALLDPAKLIMQITGTFEGGNPQNPRSITTHEDGNTVEVFPFCEDENAGYKFRLDLKAISNGDSPRRINLRVHWEDMKYNEYRTTIYARSARSDWKTYHGSVSDGTICYDIELFPGENYLTLNPKYDYRDYLTLIQRAASSPALSTALLTTTVQGREVWLLSTPAKREARRVLVTARAHPYETGGSYCVEGALERIFDRPSSAIPSDMQLHFLPMLCPDGVAEGFCRLSGKGGEDVARSDNTEDPLVSSLFSVADEVEPHFILDFHNWMLHDRNGLFYEGPLWMRRFARRIERLGHRDRKWTFGARNLLFPRHPAGLKAFAKEKYGTRCMTVEYPWANRTVEQMKTLGADTIAVLAEMLGK